MEDKVVISGIGGKFPDCYNFDEFKAKLIGGENLLKSDPERTNRKVGNDKPLSSGKIPEWDHFDPTFFGVNSFMAHNSDPVKGHTLMRAFEAIIDSGTNPFDIKGHNVAVLTMTGFTESDCIRYVTAQGMHATGLIGNAKAMMANRISYLFNFKGPSYQLDGSGSGGILILEKAAELVRQGAAESALVVAGNLFHWDSVDAEFDGLNILSPTRTCHPFDERADGFVRSEGIVAFYLQKAQYAKRNYCTILKSQTRYLGDKLHSFVKGNPEFRDFLTNFYEDKNVDPSEVAYVEANCCSNHELDALELNAINQVLKKKNGSLLIGSVAGNVGYAEAAAGFMSLTKAITALETGIIPKTINYDIPNSNVPGLLDNSLEPVVENTTLDGDVVAVSHIDFYGTVSHVVLERHERTKVPLAKGQLPDDGLYRLVVIQARNESEALNVLKELSDMPLDTDFVGLTNNLFRNSIPSYLHRGYTILPCVEGKLVQNSLPYDAAKRPVWYIFSGMGSQWAGMGRDLLQFPVFAAAIDKCDKVLRPRGLDIRDIITTEDPTVFDNILNCFVGIAAIQIGLLDILTTVGISPDGMIGHSVGELGCAYADGCFTAEQMILAAYARGQASLEATLIPGMMAAVGLGYNDIKDKLPASIDVACHNARDSCTLSGPTEDINTYVKQLQDQGVFARAVSAGGIAYHSRYIKKIAPKLLEYLNEVLPNPKPRSSKWISSSVPETEWNTDKAKLCSAEYHTNNLLSPVLFEEACKHLPENAVLVEIAPRGLLQAILRRSVVPTCVSLSLTNRNMSSNVMAVLDTLGKMYMYNVDVDVNALYPPLQYPVPRNTPGLAKLATYDHEITYYTELIRKFDLLKWDENSMGSRIVEVNTHVPEYTEWNKCSVNGQVYVPLSCLMSYVKEIFVESLKDETVDDCIVFEDVTIKANLSTDKKDRYIAIHISSIGHFEVTELSNSNFGVAKDVVRGTICTETPSKFELPQNFKDIPTALELENIDVSNYLRMYGVDIESNYQLIHKMWLDEAGCSAHVEWTGDITGLLNSLFNVVIVFHIDVLQQLLNISSLKKFKININMLSTLPIGTIVDVVYDHFCKTLVCAPVQISGLTLHARSTSKAPNLTWTHMSLQPYFDTNLSFSNFVSSCVQLSMERGFFTWNKKPAQLEVMTINNIHLECNSFTEEIQKSAKLNENIQVHFTNVDLNGALNILQSSVKQQRFLVIGNGKDVLTLSGLHEKFENVFYFTHLTSNHLKQVVPIIALKHEGKCFVLLKMVKPLEEVKCVEAKNLDWLQSLRQTVQNDNNEYPVILFTHSLKAKDVLPVLAQEPYAERIRAVFVEDKDAPQFNLKLPLYQAQMRLGLPVNILSNKMWNSLRTFCIQPSPSSTSLRSSLNKGIMKEVINYIGFNSNMTSVTQTCIVNEGPNEIRYLDYSGVENGKKVMGIAYFDPVSNSVSLDPILKWETQDSWSLEDLVTIPATYVLAYFCLLEGKLKPSESVLVHLGMSLIGQALVNLCLNMGATVYVSVNNDNEAIEFQKQCPQLVADNIVILERQGLKTKLKVLTNGKGVHLVLNGHLGKNLKDAISLVKPFGRLYHLGDTKTDEEAILGLQSFFNNTHVRGIYLSSAIDCDEKTKHKLQKVVDFGLKTNTVKPLKRQIFRYDQQLEAVRNSTMDVTKKSVFVVNNTSLLAVNAATYECQSVVLAGGKTDFWLDVVEWLVDEGCRKVTIVLADEQKDMCYMRRIHRLVESKKTALAFTSTVKLGTREHSVELLSELTNVAQVSSIFCIEMDENSEIMRNLDWACREVLPELEQFVCLLGEGTAVSESREASGLPVISVQKKTHLGSPKHILPYCTTILRNTMQPSGNIFYVEDVDSTASIDDSELKLLLPSFDNDFNVMDLEKVKFEEVVTLSPGYSHVGHCLLPLFFIPGLDSSSLQPLFKQLLYPAFCCTPAFTLQSVEDYANKLLQHITNIQNRGPYNIVGESWGGVVAIALSRKLEALGHQVHLYFIEASSSLLQQRISALNKIVSGKGRNLLSKSNIETHKNITPFDLHIDTLNLYLDNLNLYLGDNTAAKKIQGSVTIIKRDIVPIDFEDLCKLSVKLPTFYSAEEKDYQHLISSPATATFINDNVAFSWNN